MALPRNGIVCNGRDCNNVTGAGVVTANLEMSFCLAFQDHEHATFDDILGT